MTPQRQASHQARTICLDQELFCFFEARECHTVALMTSRAVFWKQSQTCFDKSAKMPENVLHNALCWFMTSLLRLWYQTYTDSYRCKTCTHISCSFCNTPVISWNSWGLSYFYEWCWNMSVEHLIQTIYNGGVMWDWVKKKKNSVVINIPPSATTSTVTCF